MSKAITLLQNTEPTTDGDDANGNLTLDLALCPAPTLSVGNLVWLDANGNGVKDASEPGVPNATVTLYIDADNNNSADGGAIATTTTDANGNYKFNGLAANNYMVAVKIPTGYTSGAISGIDPDNDVDNDNNDSWLVGANQPGSLIFSKAITLLQYTEPTNDGDDNNSNLTLDLSLCPAPTLKLGNLVWLDTNGNNVRDAGEPGIANVTVNLFVDADNNNGPDYQLATTTTDANGNYQFTGLAPNNYIVSAVIPNGYAMGAATTTDPDNDVDNDNNAVNFYNQPAPNGNEYSLSVTLALYTEPTNDGDDNNGNQTVDLALSLAKNLSLGNLVWLDVNGNGVKDATDPGIPGATVTLYIDANNDNSADGAAIATTTTDASGNYKFTGLGANNYMVAVTIPAGYSSGIITGIDPDNDVDNDNNDSYLIGSNQPGSLVFSKAITLAPGTEPTNDGDDANANETLDLSLCPAPALKLGNLVWLDVNGNNVKDATEPGVPGATVYLYADANNDNTADGAAIATTTTNANGAYSFSGLAGGNYIVGVVIPTGYTRGPVTTVDPDTDIDNDNNGVTLFGANQAGSEVRSLAITLSPFTEPTNRWR